MSRHRRKHPHRSRHHHSRRHIKRRKSLLRINSNVFNGIAFVIIGILLFRFSTLIFTKWLVWYEGIFWGYLIGFICLVGGLFSLVAWWRNHVLQHRIGIKMGKWN